MFLYNPIKSETYSFFPVREKDGNRYNKKQIQFDFTDMSEATVTKAKLYIYLKDSPRRLPKRLERRRRPFFVWENLPPKEDDDKAVTLIESRTINLPENTGDWLTEIDVTKQVREWIEQPEINLGLKVEVTDYHGNRLAIIAPENDEEEAHVCNI